MSEFESMSPFARIWDLSNLDLDPDQVVDLFMSMAISTSKPTWNMGINLDANRMNAASVNDFSAILSSLRLPGMGVFSVQFGFEVFVPSLSKAMQNLNAHAELGNRVSVKIPWWSKELEAMHRIHSSRMHELEENIRTLEQRRIAVMAESAKALKDASDLAQVAMKCVKDFTESGSKKLTELERKIAAESRELELSCCRAIAELLEDGVVLVSGFEVKRDGKITCEFDGIVAGKLDGQNVVVLLEVKTNVRKSVAIALQLGKLDLEWKWLSGELPLDPNEREHIESIRRAFPVAPAWWAERRRVMWSVGGKNWPDSPPEMGRPFIAVRPEGATPFVASLIDDTR